MLFQYSCPICTSTECDFRIFYTCGHSICATCILTIIGDEDDGDWDKVKCPTCGRMHETRKIRGFDNKFPKNFALTSPLLQFTCKTHVESLVDSVCTDCKETVCVKCVSQSHHNHNIRTFSEVKNQIKNDTKSVTYCIGKEIQEQIDTHISNLFDTLAEKIQNVKTTISHQIDTKIAKALFEKIENANNIKEPDDFLQYIKYDVNSMYGQLIEFIEKFGVNTQAIETEIGKLQITETSNTFAKSAIERSDIIKIAHNRYKDKLDAAQLLKTYMGKNPSLQSITITEKMQPISLDWFNAWKSYVGFDDSTFNIRSFLNDSVFASLNMDDISCNRVVFIPRNIYKLLKKSYDAKTNDGTSEDVNNVTYGIIVNTCTDNISVIDTGLIPSIAPEDIVRECGQLHETYVVELFEWTDVIQCAKEISQMLKRAATKRKSNVKLFEALNEYANNPMKLLHIYFASIISPTIEDIGHDISHVFNQSKIIEKFCDELVAKEEKQRQSIHLRFISRFTHDNIDNLAKDLRTIANPLIVIKNRSCSTENTIPIKISNMTQYVKDEPSLLALQKYTNHIKLISNCNFVTKHDMMLISRYTTFESVGPTLESEISTETKVFRDANCKIFCATSTIGAMSILLDRMELEVPCHKNPMPNMTDPLLIGHFNFESFISKLFKITGYSVHIIRMFSDDMGGKVVDVDLKNLTDRRLHQDDTYFSIDRFIYNGIFGQTDDYYSDMLLMITQRNFITRDEATDINKWRVHQETNDVAIEPTFLVMASPDVNYFKTYINDRFSTKRASKSSCDIVGLSACYT